MSKTKEIKEKSVVEELREIRDKINFEIKDLSVEQLKQYWKIKETLHPKSNWGKHGEDK